MNLAWMAPYQNVSLGLVLGRLLLPRHQLEEPRRRDLRRVAADDRLWRRWGGQRPRGQGADGSGGRGVDDDGGGDDGPGGRSR